MAVPKPNLNKIWASIAAQGHVLDPDDWITNKFLKGWELEEPYYQHMNFVQQHFSSGLAYLNEQGVAEWDAETSYPVNGIVKGTDGNLYRAQVTNQNVDPVTDGTNKWALIAGGDVAVWGSGPTYNLHQYVKGPTNGNLYKAVAQNTGVNPETDNGAKWELVNTTVLVKQAVSGFYDFDNSIVASDPGQGSIRTNDAPAASTAVYVSAITNKGIDATSIIVTMGENDIIYAQDSANSANFVRYRVTGAAVDNGGWFTIPVEYVEGAGAVSKNTEILVRYAYGDGAGTGGGITTWDSGTEYASDDYVKGPTTGALFRSISASNIGNDPEGANNFWVKASLGGNGVPYYLDVPESESAIFRSNPSNNNSHDITVEDGRVEWDVPSGGLPGIDIVEHSVAGGSSNFAIRLGASFTDTEIGKGYVQAPYSFDIKYVSSLQPVRGDSNGNTIFFDNSVLGTDTDLLAKRHGLFKLSGYPYDGAKDSFLIGEDGPVPIVDSDGKFPDDSWVMEFQNIIFSVDEGKYGQKLNSMNGDAYALPGSPFTRPSPDWTNGPGYVNTATRGGASNSIYMQIIEPNEALSTLPDDPVYDVIVYKSTDDGMTWAESHRVVGSAGTSAEGGWFAVGDANIVILPYHVYYNDQGVTPSDMRVLITTDDGANWNDYLIASGPTPGGDSDYFSQGAAIFSGKIVQYALDFGQSNPTTAPRMVAFESTNSGVTWAESATTIFDNNPTFFLYDVAQGGGKTYLAGGTFDTLQVITTTDGTNYSIQSLSDPVTDQGRFGDNAYVAYNNVTGDVVVISQFIADSGDYYDNISYSFVSSDSGATWTKHPINLGAIKNVRCFGGKFYAVAGNQYLVSTDGISWERHGPSGNIYPINPSLSADSIPLAMSFTGLVKLDAFTEKFFGNERKEKPVVTGSTDTAKLASLIAALAEVNLIDDQTT